MNTKNALAEPLLPRIESNLSSQKGINIELSIINQRGSEIEKFDERKMSALKLFRGASQLELNNENLEKAKKNPFNFEKWIQEISEFKLRIINEYSKNLRVMDKSQANTIKAKRMNLN